MYKSKHNITIRWVAIFLTAFMIFCSVFSLFNYPPARVYAEDTPTLSTNQLQNGSFEEGQTWTSPNYKQPLQSEVPHWNTTAFQGKIELFRNNTGTYISGVTLTPTNGSYAAELNADEESTLYQNVKTYPSSVYEWGLDHGGRNVTDTMALIIGPKQSVNPSKPSKDGRDQFMQMVDWLIAQGKTSVKTSAGVDKERIIVYSKKFAASGTFADNAGNNAFSLTPSTIYTEEWHIWIMASSKATSGTNPWSHYGSNDNSSAKSGSGTSGTSSELNEYYHYIVPAGQTETVFGFVSVGGYNGSSTATSKTFGNFLDNINFKLYHPLSGSTTTHGSVIIGGSDGTTGSEGSSEGHKVTVDDKLATYVENKNTLKIQAILKKDDLDDGCEFIGLYYTYQDENDNPVTEFLKLAGNVINDTGSLTEEEKKGKWIKSTNADGDTVYTYYLENLTSATDLHFVFLKSPTVTYDSNGGKAYKVESQYNTGEAENVYSFKPDVSAETQVKKFIPPYVSKAAEGQNDGWKFMGWLLTGDTVDNVPEEYSKVNADQSGSLLLPGVHTVACDYSIGGVNGDEKAQYFKIYNGNVTLTNTINKDDNNEVLGVTWTDNGEEKAYANVHKGLTMIAQWRWRQAFIPQVEAKDGSYINSSDGGKVEITSVTDKSNENYNAEYNYKGGKSYHAATDEKVTVTATANKNYTFVGWYDENGNLVSTHSEYSYIETNESVNTYYARFSNSVTQTYIRQVWNGNTKTWDNTKDNAIGTLGRYTYTDAVGMPISSTATAGSLYDFVGWYDSEGTRITTEKTLSYTTTGDATYYARFQKKMVTQTYKRQVMDSDTWKDTTNNNVGTLTDYGGGKQEIGNIATSTATAGDGYQFIGWYDVNDNLKTKNETISYTTTGDATYYAKFKKIVTQTYTRQIKNGDTWEDTTDDNIGTLSSYTHNNVVGTSVTSTATVKSGYKFVGWFDSDSNAVDDIMLTNDGKTISYTTTGDTTYYARFEKVYTLNVSKIDGSKTTKDPLANAEFALYQRDNNSGEKTIVYNSESINCTIVETAVTSLNEDNTKATAVFTDKLSAGIEYYLVETKAPPKYQQLDSPLKITIDSSGNMTINDGTIEVINGNEIELENYLIPIIMPSTGTTSTSGWFIVVGFSLIFVAAIGLFWVQMRSFKQK
ncbi:MAG: SpaA isopeptide-forming pilin-related protein [Clostridia bacterium]|nr:SpaA isopeptide-forming pilin-related protein [Clostridia bacterium]